MSDATPPAKQPVNPWMVGLTVLWAGLLAVALILVILGGSADNLTDDQPGLPPSQVLAGIYYACSGVTALGAVIVIGVQLGVGALRWYLDANSRQAPVLGVEPDVSVEPEPRPHTSVG